MAGNRLIALNLPETLTAINDNRAAVITTGLHRCRYCNSIISAEVAKSLQSNTALTFPLQQDLSSNTRRQKPLFRMLSSIANAFRSERVKSRSRRLPDSAAMPLNHEYVCARQYYLQDDTGTHDSCSKWYRRLFLCSDKKERAATVHKHSNKTSSNNASSNTNKPARSGRHIVSLPRRISERSLSLKSIHSDSKSPSLSDPDVRNEAIFAAQHTLERDLSQRARNEQTLISTSAVQTKMAREGPYGLKRKRTMTEQDFENGRVLKKRFEAVESASQMVIQSREMVETYPTPVSSAHSSFSVASCSTLDAGAGQEQDSDLRSHSHQFQVFNDDTVHPSGEYLILTAQDIAECAEEARRRDLSRLRHAAELELAQEYGFSNAHNPWKRPVEQQEDRHDEGYRLYRESSTPSHPPSTLSSSSPLFPLYTPSLLTSPYSPNVDNTSTPEQPLTAAQARIIRAERLDLPHHRLRTARTPAQAAILRRQYKERYVPYKMAPLESATYAAKLGPAAELDLESEPESEPNALGKEVAVVASAERFDEGVVVVYTEETRMAEDTTGSEPRRTLESKLAALFSRMDTAAQINMISFFNEKSQGRMNIDATNDSAVAQTLPGIDAWLAQRDLYDYEEDEEDCSENKPQVIDVRWDKMSVSMLRAAAWMYMHEWVTLEWEFEDIVRGRHFCLV